MICKRIPLDPEDENAYLDVYADDVPGDYTRRALLVIPGGGYAIVCSAREGEPIGVAFAPYGFNYFVLHYSVKGKKTFPAQLIQASKAVAHIKDHAAEYHIDPNEVFAVGFSAGAHLTACLGTIWHLPAIYEATGIPYAYNKPKGVMLIYPVISAYYHVGSFKNLYGKETITDEERDAVSLEKHVDENSCPAYLFHTANDPVVNVNNSLKLAEAYAAAKVPFELHVYPDGPHGVGLANEITACGNPAYINPHLDRWAKDAAKWAMQV